MNAKPYTSTVTTVSYISEIDVEANVRAVDYFVIESFDNQLSISRYRYMPDQIVRVFLLINLISDKLTGKPSSAQLDLPSFFPVLQLICQMPIYLNMEQVHLSDYANSKVKQDNCSKILNR